MAIHSPTHRSLDWLLKDVCQPEMILQLSGKPINEWAPQPPGDRWPESLPGPSTNDQEGAQLELMFRALEEQ